MKPAIIFTSGLIAAAAGVFVRSCTPHIPDAFLGSWCGGKPPSSLVSAAHAHCAGCALIAMGIGLAVIAAVLAINVRQRAPKRVTR
ncbi:MAG: hypothetical protein QM773_06870 [Hyphomonadaceae bacterium]